MLNHHTIIKTALAGLVVCLTGMSCKKLVAIPEPVDTITTVQVFSTEKQAEGAIAGVYTKMINGNNPAIPSSVAYQSFSAGLSTIAGGLSSGELYNYGGVAEQGWYVLGTNKLTAINSRDIAGLWSSAYETVYGANAVIEGIAQSTAATLRDSVRKELTGEAKFVRAFCYFYLTNFFGEVPLALTVDFNKTVNLAKAPQKDIYQQIVKDLKEAEAVLPADYSVGKGERGRPNKWAATALLARVYLYMGDYANAALMATAVIKHSELYNLEADPGNVFSTGSRETIWQLQQTTINETLRNATPEGYIMIPSFLYTAKATFCLSGDLINAFEPTDTRRVAWIDSTDNSLPYGISAGISWYPTKYTIGYGNAVLGAPVKEYYVALRLAEMYLVRAEAAANGATGGSAAAIDDIRVIRNRAGLPGLSTSLTQPQVIAAIAKERQVELFAEWGHRWFDLKRTSKAHDVLSGMPLKQPWAGDHQLLYPIPVTEIRNDHFLIQNTGY